MMYVRFTLRLRIGAFVLTSGTARTLYERAGLRDIGVQTEMMAPLALLADAEI